METLDPLALREHDWVCFLPYKACRVMGIAEIILVSEYTGLSTEPGVVAANTWYGAVWVGDSGTITLLPEMILAKVPPPIPED